MLQAVDERGLWKRDLNHMLPVFDAAIDEGRSAQEPYSRTADLHNGRKAHLINESLAEWASLNYFRHDRQIFTIIRNHAMSGDLPEWPYAGAMLVERKHGNAGLASFRSLLNLLRSNPDEAYGFLKMK